jgi:hypothetical protein
MNGNFFYNSYSDNSFTPPTDESNNSDSIGTRIDAKHLSSMNSASDAVKATSATMMPNDGPNSTASNQRRQTMQMDFSGNQNALHNAMRRLSAVDFENEGMNPFSFDNALTASLDPALAGDLRQMNLDFQNEAAKQARDLSVDTQFANTMGFNQLAAQNPNFTSPLDMNMSPYMGSAGGMGMRMNMGLDLDMMGDDMGGMNDLFNNHQFESPIMTSPMTTNFAQAMYGSGQDADAAMDANAAMDATSSLIENQPNMSGAAFQMSTTTVQALNIQMPQVGLTSGRMQTKGSIMNAHSSTSSSIKRQQASQLATIGNLTLPWSDPAGMFDCIY